MATKPTPPVNFNWVAARGKCYVENIFKDLELGAKFDVDEAQKLVPDRDDTKFSLVPAYNGFSVIRKDSPVVPKIAASADFYLSGGRITVKLPDGSEVSADLTLNNEGVCKLVVNGEELDQW